MAEISASPARQALAPLFDAHLQQLYRFLARLVDPQAAEDLTQETVLRALAAYERRPPQEGLELAWLYRIARNLAIDLLRRRRSVLPLELTGETAEAPRARGLAEGASALGRDEARAAAERAIAQLPEPFHSTFLLCAIEGFSYEQAALVLGTSPKTVSSRVARSRARLRIILAAERGLTEPSDD